MCGQRRPENAVIQHQVIVDPPDDAQQSGRCRRGQSGHPKAEAQREHGACGERPAPLDEPDGGRRDGEQVGAQRHRPDDEDRRTVEHAGAGHDAGSSHEEEVQQCGSGMFCRPTGDLRPHRRVAPGRGPSPSPAERLDARSAPEDEVVGGEIALAQQLQHVIGDVDIELTRELGEVPRGATADDDMPHAGHCSELLLDRLGCLRRYVGAELEHGFGVSRRPRRGAGSSGRGCTAE